MNPLECLVTLEPETHIYRHRNGTIYTSVTTFLSAMFPFDRHRIAAEVSKKPSSRYFGIPVETILKQWDESATNGAELHEAIENWILHKTIPTGRCKTAVTAFSKGRWRGDLASETVVWNDNLKMAGTVDIMEHYSNLIDVWDIKTSRKVDDEKLEKFSMQLDIYSRFISKLYGVPARPRGIIWFEDWANNTEAPPKVLRCLDVRDRVTKALNDWFKAVKKEP